MVTCSSCGGIDTGDCLLPAAILDSRIFIYCKPIADRAVVQFNREK